MNWGKIWIKKKPGKSNIILRIKNIKETFFYNLHHHPKSLNTPAGDHECVDQLL